MQKHSAAHVMIQPICLTYLFPLVSGADQKQYIEYNAPARVILPLVLINGYSLSVHCNSGLTDSYLLLTNSVSNFVVWTCSRHPHHRQQQYVASHRQRSLFTHAYLLCLGIHTNTRSRHIQHSAPFRSILLILLYLVQFVRIRTIWPRFSTPVTFDGRGFKTEELIGNLILPPQVSIIGLRSDSHASPVFPLIFTGEGIKYVENRPNFGLWGFPVPKRSNVPDS